MNWAREHPAVSLGLLITLSLLLILLAGCGAPVDPGGDDEYSREYRRDCEQDGGTFTIHSNGQWSCMFLEDPLE